MARIKELLEDYEYVFINGKGEWHPTGELMRCDLCEELYNADNGGCPTCKDGE